eukprot:scaffold53737_cov67-Phaeocystis_antarctica.AAC.2
MVLTWHSAARPAGATSSRFAPTITNVSSWASIHIGHRDADRKIPDRRSLELSPKPRVGTRALGSRS